MRILSLAIVAALAGCGGPSRSAPPPEPAAAPRAPATPGAAGPEWGEPYDPGTYEPPHQATIVLDEVTVPSYEVKKQCFRFFEHADRLLACERATAAVKSTVKGDVDEMRTQMANIDAATDDVRARIAGTCLELGDAVKEMGEALGCRV